MEPSWNAYELWLSDTIAGPLPVAVEPPAPARLKTDSRAIGRGDWFVPLSGERFDGHRFISSAVAAGAAGYLYVPGRFDPARELPAGGGAAAPLPVGDALLALQRIAAGWRGACDGTVIVALTGSSGKTTTRAMLARVLSRHAPTLTSPGNYNNEIGVPLTLLQLSSEHRYAALELAARHAGDIAFLTELVRPDVAACLNVGRAHLGEFGSLEALLRTKLEIFSHAPVDAVRVAPEDDPRLRFAATAGGARAISFGWSEAASVRVLEARPEGLAGQAVTLSAGGARITCRLMTPHAAAPANAAAAAAMALAAGVPAGEIGEGLEGFAGLPGRFRLIETGRQLIVDDCYNANPESTRAGLETLAAGAGGRRVALVLGDMLELGEDASTQHAEIGRLAARSIDPELLVLVGPLARVIGAGARAAGLPADRLVSFEDVAGLLDGWPPGLERAEIVFVKASRSIGLERVVQRLAPESAGA
jgi:UDP-N-acetylmuramoyl-tripeptide--D-alanyl-D-alanine ligase